MHLQHAVYSRSSIETHSNSQDLGPNTIVFIVLGVVGLLALLIGFYLVGRPRVACEVAPNSSGFHLQHSPITPSSRPQRKRAMSERSKIWSIWRHTSSTAPPNTADSPTSQLSPPSVIITTPSRMAHDKGGSGGCPSIPSRPSQSRRVTSLSVATSFSHSHITEEALSDLHASAYDLDGDLETEMLHSAMDDAWTGHPLAVRDEEGYVVAGGTEARGNVTPIAEGSVEVEGDVPTRPATQSKPEGDDYENPGASLRVACGGDGVDGGVSEVHHVAG